MRISPALAFQILNILASQPGMLVENLFVSLSKARFFYQSTTKEEVDIILSRENRFLPMEIKYGQRIQKKDMAGLKSFMNRYNSKKGYLISYDFEKEYSFSGGKISIVPAWKFLLILNDETLFNSYSLPTF